MNDKYNIDSHKLIYHPIEVAKWISATKIEDKKKIYPIYVEISPYGGCNHRCTFCALDFMGYKNIALKDDKLKECISNMAKNGVKSVMFAGEGEPLLYKNLDDVIEHCAIEGIDSALTTNFVPTNKKAIDKFLKYCKWIKVSLNAGTSKTYAEVHQTKSQDFDRVIENLKYAIKIRKENNYSCTLGVQTILLPDNKDEAIILAKLCKEMGVDYLVIKPYSQHLSSNNTKYAEVDYSTMLDIQEELKQFNDDNFNVVFRINTIKKYIAKKHDYKTCYSTPYFWGYLASNGEVYGCSAYLGNEKFCYGNIYDNSFSEIWEGEKRAKSIQYIENELDINNCRVNCRMNHINEYLWRLKHPKEHDNFI